MTVPISDAGIAGPTLAYWLARYSFDLTLIESAPALRTDGYVIDFWGSGFDVAERMHLLDEIGSHGYTVERLLLRAEIEVRPGSSIVSSTLLRIAWIADLAIGCGLADKMNCRCTTHGASREIHWRPSGIPIDRMAVNGTSI